MRNPKDVITIHDKSTYAAPSYLVTDEGIREAKFDTIVFFCKGNKEDGSVPRQEGVFTESLLEVCRKYLVENNVGDLASRETSIAITKIEEAQLWLGKRAEDRKARGVQTTYRK